MSSRKCYRRSGRPQAVQFLSYGLNPCDRVPKIIQYRELASRMFPIAMNAMSPDDLRDMINFRLSVAGYRGEIFEDADEAYKKLYTYTKGLPRDAIKVCFELFIELAAQGRRKQMPNILKKLRRGKTFTFKIWEDLTP